MQTETAKLDCWDCRDCQECRYCQSFTENADIRECRYCRKCRLRLPAENGRLHPEIGNIADWECRDWRNCPSRLPRFPGLLRVPKLPKLETEIATEIASRHCRECRHFQVCRECRHRFPAENGRLHAEIGKVADRDCLDCRYCRECRFCQDWRGCPECRVTMPRLPGLPLLPTENGRLHDEIERIAKIVRTAEFAGQRCPDFWDY